MTLDGFLTFLTLIIAAYGIAPGIMRLRLRLHTVLIVGISALGFLAVTYLETYPAFALPCPAILGSACRYLIIEKPSPGTASLVSGQLAFGAVIVWLVLATIILTRRRIFSWAIPTLQHLVDELLYEQRYGELIKVVEPHLAMLEFAARRRLWPARVRDWFARFEPPPDDIAPWLAEAAGISLTPPSLGSRLRQRARSAFATFRFLLPSGRKIEQAAQEVLRELLLSPRLTEHIALYRPQAGVTFLRISTANVHNFCDDYMVALISDAKSTLYTEVERNQNFAGGRQYDYPPDNRLLHYLFADARTAERLGVWKPLGEWLIAKLRAVKNPDYTNTLNFSSDDFEREKWQDPAYVVIFFFDLMVTAAEFQGVEWHMWLYYYPHFLDKIILIYDDSGPEVDLRDERPTRAAYLISELFYGLGHWIASVTELSAGSPHRRLQNTRVDHENGNIPKSAILALGSCLFALWRAENVGHRFKMTIYNTVMHLIGDLLRTGELSGFRIVLIHSIIAGGPRFSSEQDQAYRQWLSSRYREVDHVLRERLGDYEAALRADAP
jgi:hypothetical protein